MDLGDHVIGWTVMTPLAFVSIFIAYVTIAHYREEYRTNDVIHLVFISAIFLNLVFIFPPILAVSFNDQQWPLPLCRFVLWGSTSFRLTLLLCLIFIALDRVLILRSPKYYKKLILSEGVLLLIFIVYFVPIAFGFLPFFLVQKKYYYSYGTCGIFPFQVDATFTLITVAITTVCMLVCAALLLNGYIRVLSWEGKRREDIQNLETQTKEQKIVNNVIIYQVILPVKENFRLAVLLILLSLLLNHVPYCVLSVITFLNIASVRTCAIIMHWFLLAEGFVIAQVMWMASVRYRHACTHALRLCSCGRSEEYDVSSCRPNPSQNWRLNGFVNGGSDNDSISTERGLVRSPSEVNSQPGDRRQETEVKETCPESERSPVIEGMEEGGSKTPQRQDSRTKLDFGSQTFRNRAFIASYHSRDEINAIVNLSPVDPIAITPTKQKDFVIKSESVTPPRSNTPKLSVSKEAVPMTTLSREEWKDMMRKKHLPNIYLEEHFKEKESDEQKAKRKRFSFRSKKSVTLKEGTTEEDGSPKKTVHPDGTYISSDFHHDLLTEKLSLKSISTQGSFSTSFDGMGSKNASHDSGLNHLSNHSVAAFMVRNEAGKTMGMDPTPTQLTRLNNGHSQLTRALSLESTVTHTSNAGNRQLGATKSGSVSTLQSTASEDSGEMYEETDIQAVLGSFSADTLSQSSGVSSLPTHTDMGTSSTETLVSGRASVLSSVAQAAGSSDTLMIHSPVSPDHAQSNASLKSIGTPCESPRHTKKLHNSENGGKSSPLTHKAEVDEHIGSDVVHVNHAFSPGDEKPFISKTTPGLQQDNNEIMICTSTDDVTAKNTARIGKDTTACVCGKEDPYDHFEYLNRSFSESLDDSEATSVTHSVGSSGKLVLLEKIGSTDTDSTPEDSPTKKSELKKMLSRSESDVGRRRVHRSYSDRMPYDSTVKNNIMKFEGLSLDRKGRNRQRTPSAHMRLNLSPGKNYPRSYILHPYVDVPTTRVYNSSQQQTSPLSPTTRRMYVTDL